MAFLTREQALAAQDMKEEVVTVPEWGGDVLVIGLRGDERDDFETSLSIKKGKKREDNFANLRARLLVKTLHDGDRQRMFRDTDAKALGRKSAKALDRLFAVARRLSGLDDDDVEELVGNSESSPPDDSPSDSPET